MDHDKAYLTDLRHAGVRVAPFVFFPAGSDASAVVSRLKAEGWSRAVIKPSISGAAWKTLATTLDRTRDIEALAQDILGRSGLLAQPFFDEIPTFGEWSVLFVAGEPTHAILKTPKVGEYRSQAMWGAYTESRQPPSWLIESATKALHAAPVAPTYGRVDGFIRDGEFHLMELELIEPYFFFEYAPEETVTKFSKAIVSKLRSG